MASMHGKYFEKPKLLSEEIQDLIDYVESCPTVPKSCVIPTNEKEAATKEQDIEQGEQKQEKQQQLQPKQKKEKKQKNKQKGQTKGKSGNNGGDSEFSDIGKCEFVVGKIVSVETHPNADKMYVEMIDIGEEKPRQIVSGLKDFIPIEEMRDSLIVVFKNLKPAPLRDIMSYGMVLAASNEDHTKVEIVRPSEGSKIGERVVLETDDFSSYTVDESIKAKKKNSSWAKAKDFLKTNDSFEACFKGVRFVTSQGPLKVKTLTNATIQ